MQPRADVVERIRRRPSERQFQRAVVEWAHICGWAVVHFDVGRNISDSVDGAATYSTQARFEAPGFPDLLLIHQQHDQLVWYRELKTEAARTRLDDRQLWWRDLLTARGHNWDVWFPSKWEEIVQSLAGGLNAHVQFGMLT
jgi:hypothetical protein